MMAKLKFPLPLLLASTMGTHAARKVFTAPFEAGALDFSAYKVKDKKNRGLCASGAVDAVYTNTNPTCSADCAIANTKEGEWVKYFFKTNEDVVVKIKLNIASISRKKKVVIEVDGGPVCEFRGPSKGMDQFEKTNNCRYLAKTGVTHSLVVKFPKGGVKLCSVEAVPDKVFKVPFTASGGDFADGFDLDMENRGSCGPGPVDVSTSKKKSTCSANCYISHTRRGEWVEYKFRSDSHETVEIIPRISSKFRFRFIRVLLDGRSLGTLRGPGRGLGVYQDRIIGNVSLRGGKRHRLRVEFLDRGLHLCSISVVKQNITNPQLTMIAKYDWQDGATDVSGSPTRYDGVLSDGIVAEDGKLNLLNCSGVNLGLIEELDGADSVLLRFEDVNLEYLPGESRTSVLATGGRNSWSVGVIYYDRVGTEHDLTLLYFSYPAVEGASNIAMAVEGYALITHFDSIEFRFDGTALPGERRAMRYNDGTWFTTGWDNPDDGRTFSSSEEVKISWETKDIRNCGRWRQTVGTIGNVSIRATG